MALVLKIRGSAVDENQQVIKDAEAWDYYSVYQDENHTASVRAEIERIGIGDIRTKLIFCQLPGTTSHIPVESVAYLLEDGKTIETFRTTHKE